MGKMLALHRPREHGGPEMPHRRGLVVTMCTLIAIILWLTLSLSETYTILVEVKTKIVHMPPDTALATLPPQTVRAQISGTGTDLFGVRFDPPVLNIDGSIDVIETSTAVALPTGVTSVTYFPERFELDKEERITRRIPVRPRVTLEPVSAYDFFTDPVVIPASIDVSGAVSVINSLSEWPTEKIVRSGVRDSMAVIVPLADTLAGLVTKAAAVAVTITTRAYHYTEGSRVLNVDVTELPTMTQVVELDPPSVEVRFRVPLSQYDAAYEAEDFFATVSYESIRKDTTGRISPQIHLPPDLLLHLVETSPRTLEYFIYIGSE